MSQPKEDIYENQKRKGTNGCEACFFVLMIKASLHKLLKAKRTMLLAIAIQSFRAREMVLGSKTTGPNEIASVRVVYLWFYVDLSVFAEETKTKLWWSVSPPTFAPICSTHVTRGAKHKWSVRAKSSSTESLPLWLTQWRCRDGTKSYQIILILGP